MLKRFQTNTIGILLSVFVSLSAVSAQTPIEPLLQKYCLGCHNDTDKEGGFSLQTLDALKKGAESGPVFDPGRPEMSLLMNVLADGAEKAMPPEGEPQPTPAERELLRNWILAGADIRPMAKGTPDVPRIAPFHKMAPSLLASAAMADGLVAVGGGRHVAVLDPKTGNEKWRMTITDARVTSLSVAAAQPWLVVASGMPGVGGKALLLSTADGSTVKEFGGHTDAVYAAVINSTDSVVATAGYDRRILLHDVASGNVLKSLEGHNGSVFALSFDSSGKVLCSASADGTVKVWNVTTGERLDTLSQPTAEQYAVLVSRDGKKIYAAGADNRIRIWNLLSVDSPTINPLQVARFAHEQPITRLSLSADGSRLASAAEDGTVQVWSTEPFEHHKTLPRQDVAVTSLSFIDNSNLFLTHVNGTSELLTLTADASHAAPSNPSPEPLPATVQLPDELIEVAETEGNNNPESAHVVVLPAKITGEIKPDGGNDRDVDCFRFSAVAGQQLLLEVNAHRDKSALDSRIEVLTADGKPIVRTVLQAVRDSYFTFRGKDSDTSDDFRVFNWQEMELNQFLYSDGEVVKLWHYPRGPDSGYIVYPGFGKRFTYFDTTPTSHALQAPCFIVEAHHPNEELTANGLPSFPIYYENDDDSRRELGADSRLYFTAPADGDYVVRLTDARGFSGENYKYQLTVRSSRPDFEISVSTRKFTVASGTGQEVIFTAKRIDGYEGPITIDMSGLPDGFAFSGPLEIHEEQLQAMGTIFATDAAKEATAEDLLKTTITASTEMHGEKNLGALEELKVAASVKLKATIRSVHQPAQGQPEQPLVLTIRPGETIRALVRLERTEHQGVVSFGNADSGRNLPHGVYVDNIGLNGLLLLSEQSERQFFITASKVARPSTSTFFLKSNVDNITSQPVTLNVIDGGDAATPDRVTAR